MAQPRIQLERLLATHYLHPNLSKAQEFYTDFGFHVARSDGKKTYYRGFGEDPYLYIAEQSPDGIKAFVGGIWTTASRGDLELAARMPGASGIKPCDAPGGGEMVEIKDPNGAKVTLVHGVDRRSQGAQENEKPDPLVLNSWEEKPRKGEFQRLGSGPSKVHKLGHYGINVEAAKYEKTVNWYLDTFNLALTDAVYNPATGKDIMSFAHIDLGEEFSDHHVSMTVACPVLLARQGAPISSDPRHWPSISLTNSQSLFFHASTEAISGPEAHHSSFEIDNFDSELTGHYHLQKKGWKICWGVGRHLLGSQIFDYW